MGAPGPTHTGLHNGALLDLLAPDWRAIDLQSIALQLARIPRFLGATTRPISVLEHSLAVARIVPPRLRLAALIHDAHEALMGDLTRPVRKALEAECGSGFRAGLARLADRIDFAICMQVLTLAPETHAGERGGDAHRSLALRLMKDLASENLRVADDVRCEAEIRLFCNWGGPAEDEGRAPLGVHLLRDWHEAMEALVAIRLGAPHRVTGSSPVNWVLT